MRNNSYHTCIELVERENVVVDDKNVVFVVVTGGGVVVVVVVVDEAAVVDWHKLWKLESKKVKQ